MACATSLPSGGFARIKCAKCGLIQDPPRPPINYFAILSHPVTFRIDRAALKRSQIALQRHLHPDLAVNEAKLSEWSRLVNLAWEVLEDPLRRSHHLYGLVHDDTTHESLEGLEEKDQDLLEEIFEIRMQLASPEVTPFDIQKICHENNEKIKQTITQMEVAADAADWSAFRKLYLCMQYLYNIRDECESRKIS